MTIKPRTGPKVEVGLVYIEVLEAQKDVPGSRPRRDRKALGSGRRLRARPFGLYIWADTKLQIYGKMFRSEIVLINPTHYDTHRRRRIYDP